MPKLAVMGSLGSSEQVDGDPRGAISDRRQDGADDALSSTDDNVLADLRWTLVRQASRSDNVARLSQLVLVLLLSPVCRAI